jgi:hypothetical protein
MEKAAIPAAAVACPTCSAPVMPGDAFCEHCGVALNLTAPPLPQAAAPAPSVLLCSHCGTQLEPDSNFCDMCGAPLSEAPSPTPAPVPAPPPIDSPDEAIQGCLVVQGTNATLPFPPGKTEIVVGREDPVSGVFPAIDLTDHGGDAGGVSRQHARIFIQGTRVSIEDLNSTNYTYVNQQKLMPEQPYHLNDGDEIRLGRVKLDFHTQCVKAKE